MTISDPAGPDPDGPVNPDAPDVDLDVPVPASPAETNRDADGPDDTDDAGQEPPD